MLPDKLFALERVMLELPSPALDLPSAVCTPVTYPVQMAPLAPPFVQDSGSSESEGLGV